MNPFLPRDYDPTMGVVTEARREVDGTRVFLQNPEVDYNYVIPWTAIVRVDGQSQTVEQVKDLPEKALGKACHLTFDPSSVFVIILAAEFYTVP